MSSPELKQFEHELEAAAVHFSMAENQLTHLSEADSAQSASVSEARVVSAAINVLATNTEAPLDQLLTESVQHPMFHGSDQGQWRAFLNRVRAQLRSEQPAARISQPTTRYGLDKRPAWHHRVTGGALLVAVALGLGALLFSGESWTSTGDERCDDGSCSGGFEAIGTDVITTTTLAPPAPGTTQPGTASSIPTSTEADGAAPGTVGPDPISLSTAEPNATTPTTAQSTSNPSLSTIVTSISSTAHSSTTNANEGAPSTAKPPDQSSTTTPTSTSTPAPTTTNSPTTAVTTTEPKPDPSTTPPPSVGGVACPPDGTQTQNLNVARVASDDVLNVRLGPGTGYDIVYELPYDSTGVVVFGSNRSGNWVMIAIPGPAAAERPPNGCGWVNAFYLTEPVI